MTDANAKTINEIAGETLIEDIYFVVDSATDRGQVGRVLQSIVEYGDDFDIEENAFEVANSLVDVYNADLLKWVGSNSTHPAYVEDALSEYSYDSEGGFYKLLQLGQYLQYEQIVAEVFEVLREMTDEQNHE